MVPEFRPGNNIAVKAPAHEYDALVRFYGFVLGLQPIADIEGVVYDFGGKRLWIDRCDGLSQAEIWLEILTDDVSAAKAYFEAQGIARRDEIESLPQGLNGFWIASPGNLIHLVDADQD